MLKSLVHLRHTHSATPIHDHDGFSLISAKEAIGKFEGYEMGPKMTAWLARIKQVPALAEMCASGIPFLPDSFM